jgi:hypothetical protein
MTKFYYFLCLLIIAGFGLEKLPADPGTAFTYQGRLADGAVAIENPVDLQFCLFDSPTTGAQIGGVVTFLSTVYDGGIVQRDLDFGPGSFDGNPRWLEVKLANPAGDAFTTLTPRIQILPSPYGMYARRANNLSASDGDPIDAVVVDAEGRVGINTATPTELLTVDDGNILQTPGDPVLVGSLDIGGAANSVYVSGSYAYLVDITSNDLKVIDISDPTTPTLVGSLGIGNTPGSVYVSGSYAYVVDASSEDLKVIDVSDPSSPTLAGSLGIGNSPGSVHVVGRYAYVTDSGSNDLKVIDVSDPSSPALIGSLGLGQSPTSLYVSGRYAYVVDSSSDDLKVIDISDPSSPTITGLLGIGSSPTSVYVSGRYAYVVDGFLPDLKVIDISDPSSPSVSGVLGLDGVPTSVYVSGRYAYVLGALSDDLKVIDISDPASPALTGSLGIGSNPISVYVSGRYAYVVDLISSDLKVIDISGGEMTSLIAHSLEAGNLQVRNDIIAQGQLQVTTGVNVGAGGIYSAGDIATSSTMKADKFIGDGSMLTGIAGSTDDQTLSFTSPNLMIEDGNSVDLSALQDGVNDADADPTNELNTLLALNGMNLELTDAGGTLTADLSPLAGSVFGDGHSLDAVDGAPVDALFVDADGDVGIGTSTPAEALTVDDGNFLQTPGDPVLVGSLGLGSTPSSVYVSGRYAYVIDPSSDDLKIIDVSSPTTPTLVGQLGLGASPRSVYVTGNSAYVTDANSDDLKVIDVSNPSAPAIMGSIDIGGFPREVQVSGCYAYVLESNSDDFYVVDISNPNIPVIVGQIDFGVTISSVYVSGRYAYVTDAITNGTLRVIDISDPTAPTITGSINLGTGPFSVYVSGRYAYVGTSASNQFIVVDVSDPTAPLSVGSISTAGIVPSVFASGRYAYVVSQGTNNFRMFDVAAPNAPSLAGSLDIGDNPQDVYVSGRYAYVVDSQTDDLKIIDISGGEMTSLIAHSLEAGNLQVRNDIIAQGQLQVTTGINVGGGIYAAGDIGTSGTVKADKFIGDGSMLTNLAGSTDDQTLSFTSPNLSIEDGNTVDLSALIASSADGHSLDAVDGSTTDAVFVQSGGIVRIPVGIDLPNGTEMLDQSSPQQSDDSTIVANGPIVLGQSFTAGLTGQLTGVAVFLRSGTDNGPVDVEVFEGGDNTGVSLGIQRLEITGSGDRLFRFDLAPGISVTAGTQYFFQLDTTPISETLRLLVNNGDPYAGGVLILNGGAPGGGTFDLVFETYVWNSPMPVEP